jgi:ligand-binding SRPBCC domain-containing protein
MKYRLYREQQLNCDIDVAWRFFCDPQNLARITPKNLKFTVITNLWEEEIYTGMEIDYKVSPLFGIPMKWKTRIIQVEYHKSFTDFQEAGPYKLWHHHHEFVLNNKGVLMKDTVDYELPFAFLGTIAHFLVVKNELKKIFDYRFHILESLFNEKR